MSRDDAPNYRDVECTLLVFLVINLLRDIGILMTTAASTGTQYMTRMNIFAMTTLTRMAMRRWRKNETNRFGNSELVLHLDSVYLVTSGFLVECFY